MVLGLMGLRICAIDKNWDSVRSKGLTDTLYVAGGGGSACYA